MIEAVDRRNWITVSKITVPLKARTAKVAEVAGAYILTMVLQLMFGHKGNRTYRKNNR